MTNEQQIEEENAQKSGQQIGDDNAKDFIAWRDGMNKTPDLYYDYKRGSKLNKSRMADTLGFHGRGVFTDNSTVEDLLLDLEAELREQGILNPIKPKPADKSGKKDEPTESGPKQSKLEKEREHARDLEHDVCELIAERNNLKEEKEELEKDNEDLKQQVASLKVKLKRLEVINRSLSELGRVPR